MSVLHHRTSRRLGAVVIAPLAALGTVALLAGCGGTTTGPTTAAAAHTSATTSAATSAGASAASAGGATSSGSDAAVDLCSLLTPAQASDLEHVGYDTATSAGDVTASTCTFHNAGQGDDTGNLTTDTADTPGCFSSLENHLENPAPLSGIGDQAAASTSQGILVQSGDRCLEVASFTRAESNGDYSGDIAVAQFLLKKLG